MLKKKLVTMVSDHYYWKRHNLFSYVSDTTVCHYKINVTYINNNGIPHTNQLNLYLVDRLLYRFSPVSCKLKLCQLQYGLSSLCIHSTVPAPSLHLRQEGEYLVVSGNFSAGWSDADVTISCKDCVTVNLNLTGTTNPLRVPLDELRIEKRGRLTVTARANNMCGEVWENTIEIGKFYMLISILLQHSLYTFF